MFRFFYARPQLLAIILLLASLLGVVGYLKLPRNMYPDIERPQVTVITQLPGAAALTVAQKLSRPIEQELFALSGVRNVESTSKNEVSIVKAEFEYTKGLDAALVDVSNALSRVRAKLPAEVPPSAIYPIGSFTNPVLVLAVSPKPGSGLSLSQVRLLAENDLRAALITQPHVANVEVFGGHEPTLRVEFDPLKLARHGLSQAQFQELLAKLNRDWPLGTLQGGNATTTLTIYGEGSDAQRLRLLPVAPGLTLGDLADIHLGEAERFSAYHGNGKPAIAMAIQRAPGGAVASAIAEVEAKLPELRARYPRLEIAIADTQGELINTSNNNMMEALRDAILFTSLVILFFLGNWRAVVTALISIPLVFLITLAVLWLSGKELNTIVLTAIILALGMLVDDAVVVLENIERHLGELHEDITTAIRKGTEEVLFPVFVGTIATAVVIAPLMFVGDFTEQLFKHLVFPLVIAVLVSYFVAVTFIPRLSYFWYRNGLPEKTRFERFLERLYQRTLGPGAAMYAHGLDWSFAGGSLRRWLLVLPAYGLLVVSFMFIMPLMGRDALPPMDTGVIKAHVRFSANEPVAVAEARLAAFEQELMQDERLKRISLVFGSEPGVISLGSGQLPAEATFTLAYVNRFERSEDTWHIEADLRRRLNALPGVTAADVYSYGATPLSTIKATVDIRLYSEDWRRLPEAAAKVREALSQVPGLTSVSTVWDADAQETVLTLDEERLRSLGLTPETVVAQLPLKGAAVASLSKLATVSAIPVKSYFSDPYRAEPATLMLLPIQLPNGQSVSLGELGRLARVQAVSTLTRDRMQYSLDVLAWREKAPTSVLAKQAEAAARAVLPPGVTLVEKGDNGQGTESSKAMMAGMMMGMLLLFAVLVPAYGSFTLAGITMITLPLAAMGAAWGLLLFDKAMALPAILGIILLFSIIVKNSILMVDFIHGREKTGADPMSAARDSIRLRYRPILMTAFGTVAGMLPIALEHAVGLERLSPLADTAIGGLLLGTVLSLFYLPMFYVWVAGAAAVRTRPAGVVDTESIPP
ncbi:MAG: efflux RND transporter permease subunit [Thermochromatium sp.]